MKPFTIKLNGQPYATFNTALRNAGKVLTAYQQRMQSLGYHLPSGDWSAQPYLRNALDSFGR